jgi:hypothetical protein
LLARSTPAGRVGPVLSGHGLAASLANLEFAAQMVAQDGEFAAPGFSRRSIGRDAYRAAAGCLTLTGVIQSR